MKHFHAVSRMPARGATAEDTTAELIIAFLIALLEAIKPLVAAMDKTTA